MDQPQWELIKSIVDQALTLEGRERDTYLATISRRYPSLSTEVIEMLQGIEDSERDRFLADVRSDQKNILIDISGALNEVYKDEAFVGKEVGPYCITEIIGRGGMGAVFKASRADGAFQQDAAIKIIKTGIHTGDTVLRFKMEREILAGLQHPNIAQLFDGGVTEDGMPYLIMEYIDGAPFDEYCDQNRLAIAERLKLFKDVCSAVQYAHTKLIVHRDLKPDNIYVTNEGIVKILDFGIAKLLNPKQHQISSLETLPGQKIWTPQYAAPEQVTGEPVSTTTDIYALGILLFKILSGTYPYDLEGKNLAEMEVTIKNTPPLLPSQAVNQLINPAHYAENRKTTVRALQNSLQGDLDALVSKAIRKEPGYRYQSVKELSDDIERYQTGTPLVAREGTYRYRAGKFIRRHKAGLSAAASLLIILVLFAGIYTWRITEERNLAELERDKLEQVVDFMTGLFEASNPVSAQGEELSAIDLLERGVEQASALNHQPVLQAQMFSVIGSSYRGMNRPEKATPLLKKALEVQRDHWGKDHPDIANTLNTLGSVYWSEKQVEEADKYLSEALDMRRRLYGNNHPDVFTSMNNYALVLKDKGDLEAAEKLYLETLESRKRYYGEEHSKVGVSLNNLAFLLQQQGKYTKAEKYFRETLALLRKLQGEDHSDVGIALNNLGALLRAMGQLNEAELMLKESLEIRKKVYGPRHLKVGYCLNNLALLFKEQEEYEEAMRTAKQSLTIFRDAHEGPHYNIANALTILGVITGENEKFEEAESYYLKSLNMRLNLYPENHIGVASARRFLGELYIKYEMPGKAESMLQGALSGYEMYYPEGDMRIAQVKGLLGQSLMMQSRFSEAESLILEEYRTLNEIPGIHITFIEDSFDRLIELYESWQKPHLAKEYRQELTAGRLASNQ